MIQADLFDQPAPEPGKCVRCEQEGTIKHPLVASPSGTLYCYKHCQCAKCRTRVDKFVRHIRLGYVCPCVANWKVKK